MDKTSTYTHYGWFMFCPVYVGNLDGEAPSMDPRWWVPECWFWLNEKLCGMCIFVMSHLDDDYEPMFPIRITGEINEQSQETS